MENAGKPYLSHYTAGYHGKTNSWGKRAALKSTARDMRSRFEKAKCDSEAVSDCVRCNMMFLVGAVEDVLDATNEDGTLKTDLNRHPNTAY